MTEKLRCVVEQVAAHGDRVYSVTLKAERPVPRFRPGQFLHLAIDPYDPTSHWPESRVFSIASPPARRDAVRITYAVHGRYTARMESALVEGRQVWIKMPYGDFVVDGRTDVALFAGGTGITAFTAYLESLTPAPRKVTLAYGARTDMLLIYRDVVERCAQRLPSLDVSYFVEDDGGRYGAGGEQRTRWITGRVSVETVWPRIDRPFDTAYYLSGPPHMVRSVSHDLRVRDISPEAIHIDAWD